MKISMFSWSLVLLLGFLGGGLKAEHEDLRDQYGTQNLEAARYFQKGNALYQEKNLRAALNEFINASKTDPTFSLAYYWTALVQTDLGDVDSAMASYQSLIRVGKEYRITNVTVDGAINLALTYLQLKKEMEGARWMTEAIVLDPVDRFKLHWKAYRNMSIGLYKQNKNLSAALCAILAYEANPQKVSLQMIEEMLGRIGAEEVAEVLHFPGEPPPVLPRATPSRIEEMSGLSLTDEAVGDLLLDIKKNRLVVLVGEGRHYYLIEPGQGMALKKIPMTRPVKAGSVVAGEMFLSVDSPPAIVYVEIETGKILREWKVAVSPTSLAASPAQGMVWYPSNGLITGLDCETGTITRTFFFSTGVRADPQQRFCYSYVHPGAHAGGGHVLVNGRPVFFQPGGTDWAQTALFRYAISAKQLLCASLRLNAASNGKNLHVSPDGEWAAVVGGGGWRPEDPAQGAGYGVAIFPTREFSRSAGFFETEAYPQGVAVNHITRHVAVWRENEGRLYHMEKPKESIKFKGTFGSQATWSADGKFLFIAKKGKGLSAFELKQSPEEQRVAVEWPALMEKTYPPSMTLKAIESTPLPELAQFRIESTLPALRSLMDRIPREGRTTKPVDWMRYEKYFQPLSLKGDFHEMLGKLRTQEVGLAIYHLKELLKVDPNHPVTNHLLGMGYELTNQFDEAERFQMKAVQLDQGRTNVTVEALRSLAFMKTKGQKHIEAAYCYSYVILLDRVSPQGLKEGRSFYERAGLQKESEPIFQGGHDLTAISQGRLTKEGNWTSLPRLTLARDWEVFTPENLYRYAVNSVVMIQTSAGSGSGVCVGDRGCIVTNYHVIGQARGRVTVYPYVFSSGETKRLTPLEAEVIAQAPDQDLAVLRVVNPPATLEPLAVAERGPEVGMKVFALGSPGMGDQVLEQSMTDGMVSSASREVEGQNYVQHTAPVNPGNSGGPLVDERGRVVGINTLKATLEGVSFAIPPSRIRKVFQE